MVEANVGNCGLLACTKKSWANKVRETANGIAKCARNSFAIRLPTGCFMHGVGTVGGGQHLTFTRARSSTPARAPARFSEGYGSLGDERLLSRGGGGSLGEGGGASILASVLPRSFVRISRSV